MKRVACDAHGDAFEFLIAFTPKGGCPLKPEDGFRDLTRHACVAFTPKGGCPLKPILI